MVIAFVRHKIQLHFLKIFSKVFVFVFLLSNFQSGTENLIFSLSKVRSLFT